MVKPLNTWVALFCLVAMPGCIIGTWPTPEERQKGSAGNPSETLATEPCDGVDNDGDGAVDEGCACTAEARGCIGVAYDTCGVGIQWCVDGFWQGCTDIDAPTTSPRAPQVAFVAVSPSRLVRGGVETLTLAVEPVTVCAGIAVDHVDVSLASTTPVMRIRGPARDDGVAPDAVAGDGIYTVAFVNPFGPGVPAQTLLASGVAVIDRVERAGVATLPLEDP